MNKDNEAGEFKPGIDIERDCLVHRSDGFRPSTVPFHRFYFPGTIRICPGLTIAIIFEQSYFCPDPVPSVFCPDPELFSRTGSYP